MKKIWGHFTEREIKYLEGLAKGKKISLIARENLTCTRVVYNTLARVRLKLGADNNEQAIYRATRYRLLFRGETQEQA
jgi:DNA-binding NarL/FixJ family response regulator